MRSRGRAAPAFPRSDVDERANRGAGCIRLDAEFELWQLPTDVPGRRRRKAPRDRNRNRFVRGLCGRARAGRSSHRLGEEGALSAARRPFSGSGRFDNDSRALAQGAIHACDYKPPTTGELRFTSGDVNELAAAYGARVTGELQRLRVNSDRQVYFVLDSGIGFVQCAPQDKPPSQYCEAQSADSWPALASVLTPERVARLHALGYAEPGRSPITNKSTHSTNTTTQRSRANY